MQFKEIVRVQNFTKVQDIENNLQGLLDKNNYLIGNRFYTEVDIIYHSLGAVKDGHFWLIFNDQGIKINQRQYKKIITYPLGFIGALEANNQWSILDKEGKYLYDSCFTELTWINLDIHDKVFEEGYILGTDKKQKHHYISSEYILEKLDKHLTNEFRVQDSSFVQGWNFMSLPSLKAKEKNKQSRADIKQLSFFSIPDYSAICQRRDEAYFKIKFVTNFKPKKEVKGN